MSCFVMASPAAAPDACSGFRSGWRDRRGGFQTFPYNAGRMPKRYPARRRRPALVVRAEPGSLHSLRSVGMTGGRSAGTGFRHVMKCHVLSCSAAIRRDGRPVRSPAPPRLRRSRAPSGIDRPFCRTRFFCTRPSVRSRATGPDRRKPPAGGARRRDFVHIMFLCGRQALSCGVSVRVPACGVLC